MIHFSKNLFIQVEKNCLLAPVVPNPFPCFVSLLLGIKTCHKSHSLGPIRATVGLVLVVQLPYKRPIPKKPIQPSTY